MLRRVAILGLAALLSSLGCSEERDSAADDLQYVGVTASLPTVLANGMNTVTLTVTDTGGGPVTVTTTRGRFPSGATTATVPGASGSLFLITCNAMADLACAGDAIVTASSPTGTSSVTIGFRTLTDACTTNCNADPACASLACASTSGATGTCSGTSPSACITGPACTSSPSGATTETSCTDGIDNNCSAGADGDDPACEGRPCDAGSATLAWKSGVCADITAGLGIKVTPARTRLPADGTTATTVVVEVTSDDAPSPDMAVTISTSLGTIAGTTATTGPDGKVSFTFTSTATPGVATITAAVTSLPNIRSTATVTIPRLGSFQVLPNAEALQHSVMGVKTSGWNELGWIQVQVLDDAGLPYPDGLAVRFEHRRLGGSTLGAPLTADTGSCTAASGCVGYLGAISSGAGAPDTTGLASAFLHSGTVAGTLVVTATATAGGVTRSATLPTAAVVGAKASGADYSVVCSPRNVPALAETSCAVSLVDAPFRCAALAKDRFGNVLGRETQVIFVSEAAAVGKVATTPAYDPEAGGDSQMDLGIAEQGFRTLGSGLPFDVDPASGEPSVLHGLDGCGVRTHNPRDGVVTIVAIADGEEAFWDANGNGSFDASPTSEPFVDLGEPYVDQDDDAQYDAGEWFLDVDGNGAWTAPNGVWDANTKIWTQTVVVYTGSSATLASGGKLLGTRWAGSDFVDACTSTSVALPFDVEHASTTATNPTDTYTVVASDTNLNFLNTGTAYGVSVQPDDAPIEVVYRGLEAYTDLLGLSYRYWPCDKNGNCASQCRATGSAAPCTMRPSITGFSCGVAASVDITGGDEAGAGSVVWSVDVPWTVYDGVGRIAHDAKWLSGIVR